MQPQFVGVGRLRAARAFQAVHLLGGLQIRFPRSGGPSRQPSEARPRAICPRRGTTSPAQREGCRATDGRTEPLRSAGSRLESPAISSRHRKSSVVSYEQDITVCSYGQLLMTLCIVLRFSEDPGLLDLLHSSTDRRSDDLEPSPFQLPSIRGFLRHPEIEV